MRAAAWLMGVPPHARLLERLPDRGNGRFPERRSHADAFGDGPADGDRAPIEGEFPPIQAYPPGPYGYGIGAVIDNLEFIGWRDPVASGYDVALLEHVRLGDFYDPTGTNTELIVINASAVWCTVCQAEMRDMNRSGTYEAFRARKVQVFGTLFEDGAGDPAEAARSLALGLVGQTRHRVPAGAPIRR
jgi:hypothetical protein